MAVTGKEVKRWIAGGVLAIVALLLVSSEASLKRLISDWFDSCSIVVEVGRGKANKDKNKTLVPVNLYVQGKTPDTIQLAFKSTDEIIWMVEFERNTAAANRAIHPFSGISCPSDPDFCGDTTPTGDKLPKQIISLNLQHFHSVFDYKFLVHVDAKTKSFGVDSLEVFVIYPENTVSNNKDLCRVERNSLSNILVWVDPVHRLILSTIFVFLLTILVLWLRGVSKNEVGH